MKVVDLVKAPEPQPVWVTGVTIESEGVRMIVRWGVLGTAAIAANCTIPGMKKATNCELYAIAGRSEEKVRQYQEKFGFQVGYVGYEALLQDPKVDAVYIPLPNHFHKQWVIAALRAGKHVLCEKPLALNAEDAEEMYQVAQECGVYLMEAYAYLHSTYVESLCEDVASGIIGDLVYIDTAFLTQGYRKDFRLHKPFGGGMIYDLGCYCTTMILSLLRAGAKISVDYVNDGPSEETVSSRTYSEAEADFDWHSLLPVYVRAVAEMSDEASELGDGTMGDSPAQSQDEDRVDAFAGAILKFKNGVRASFDVGMILGVQGFGRYDRLYIHGTKGAIRSEVEYNQEGALSYRITTGDVEIERRVFVDQNYKLEVEQLGRCILGEEKPHITPAFSTANARLLDMLLEKVGY